MSNRKKHSAKLLWRTGVFLTTLIIAGIPTLLCVLFEIISLYKFKKLDFGDNHIFLGIFFLIIIICFCWIRMSQIWLKWALNRVKEEDVEYLNNKIKDKEESFVIKPWSQLSNKIKVVRVVVIIALFIGAIIGDHVKNDKNEKFHETGITTSAKVDKVYKTFKRKQFRQKIEYQYKVQDKILFGTKIGDSGFWLNIEEKNGFDIVEGDEFEVVFLPADKESSRLKLGKPLKHTEARYLSQTEHAIKRDFDTNYDCKCVVLKVYDEFGLNGLAYLKNKEMGYWENSNFNHIKYEKLLKKDSFKALLSQCSK